MAQMTETALPGPNDPNHQNCVVFARREMGSQVRIENFSRDFGRASIVWRLTGGDGTRAWLKHHERSQLYEREVFGLEQLVPALGAQTWWSSPTLIAKDDAMEVILMSEVEGEELASAFVSADERTTMFRLAGQFLRKLHELEVGMPDGIRGVQNRRERLERYLIAGEASIDSGIADWTRTLIEQACSVEEAKRVPCHMDYSPRNWLIHRHKDGLRFGVIDWERSCWDLWLQDVQRLVYNDWHLQPHLRDVYFEGYGREPSEAEALQLHVLCLVTTIAGIPWAISRNDHYFAALCREMIERIRAKMG